MTSHFEADHLDGHDQLSGLWEDGLLVWKDASTWHERLSTWLAPWLVPEGKAALERLGEQDICHDISRGGKTSWHRASTRISISFATSWPRISKAQRSASIMGVAWQTGSDKALA